MKKVLIILTFALLTTTLLGQAYLDTIIAKSNQTIICTIRSVDKHSISYIYSEGGSRKPGKMNLSDASYWSWNSDKEKERKFRKKYGGSDSVQVFERNNRECVHAASTGSINRVEQLLNEGADVNAISYGKWTALTIAAFYNRNEMIILLLDHGAEINIKNGYGKTALFYVLKERRFGVAEKLLKEGAETKSIKIGGWTPLTFVARYGQAGLVELMLEKGAEINEQNDYGYTPMFYAKKYRYSEIIDLLKVKPDLSFFSIRELKEMYREALNAQNNSKINYIQKELANRKKVSSVSYTETPVQSATTGQMRGSGDPLKGLNVSRAAKEMKIGNYYALLIGIDNYSGVWNPLLNAVNDAKAIEELLRSKYVFDKFITLYNERATRSVIIKQMEWLVDNVGVDDNVFIYYSGHGEFKKNLNKGYWVPVDASSKSTSEYISNNDIQTFLGGIKSKHTLLVSDACFSGDIFRGQTVSVPFEDSERYYKKVHTLMSRNAISSGGIEPVMDGGKDGHSVFAYYILKSLRNNTAKYYDASQLYSDIKIPVVNNSEQTPKFSPIKNTGDEGGQFIFIRKDLASIGKANAEAERLKAEARRKAEVKAKEEAKHKALEKARIAEEAKIAAAAETAETARQKEVARARAEAEAEVKRKAAEEARKATAAKAAAAEAARRTEEAKATAEEEARQKAAAKTKAEEEARQKAAAKAKAEKEARQKTAAKTKAEEEARQKAAAKTKAEEEARIKAELKSSGNKVTAESKYSKYITELNSATKKDLKELDGIDGVFSDRIIKYRDLLGGFAEREQLLEVNGINNSLFLQIKQLIKVDKRKILKININTCASFDLQKHPYISTNVANAIINYRDQHGKYASISDIKNINLIDDGLYNKIKAYISEKDEKPFVEAAKVASIVINLNSTNKNELKTLEGLSSALSDKVIKFRDLLGGFINKEQLLEVDGINSSLLDKISANLVVDVRNIRKININTCSSFHLAKHPYITLDVATAIINYRGSGTYSTIQDIKKIKLVNDALYLKIMPYLTLP